MDKHTAADLLDNLIGMVDDTQGNDYDTALRMGIKALREERHGTWSEDGGELKCSECHSIFFNDIMDMNKDEMPSFCPVCGARMGG